MSRRTKEHEFEVWQDGQAVASVSASDQERALRDALHYFAIYSQDGPCELYVVEGRKRHRVEIEFEIPTAEVGR